MGRCALELAQGPSRVALAWHIAGGSSPLWVTDMGRSLKEVDFLAAPFLPNLFILLNLLLNFTSSNNKLTWLVLGGDPAARSHRVEQFTAL